MTQQEHWWHKFCTSSHWLPSLLLQKAKMNVKHTRSMDQNKWEPQQPHIKEHIAKRNIRGGIGHWSQGNSQYLLYTCKKLYSNNNASALLKSVNNSSHMHIIDMNRTISNNMYTHSQPYSIVCIWIILINTQLTIILRYVCIQINSQLDYLCIVHIIPSKLLHYSKCLLLGDSMQAIWTLDKLRALNICSGAQTLSVCLDQLSKAQI